MTFILPSIGSGIIASPTAPPAFSNTYSVDFDGTDDHASTAFVTDDYNLKDGFTVSLWVNLDSASGIQDFFGRYGSSTSRFYFGISGSNLRVAIGTAFDTTSLSHGLSTGLWSHVAYTFSGGSSGTFTYYVNGSSVGTLSFTWTFDNVAYEPMHIGALKNGANTNQNPTDGKLDEMAIFNSALSSSAISNIYNSGVPTDLSSYSPVGWWRMGDNDGGTGTTITDQGSGGNDATLVNGPTFSTNVPTPAYSIYSVDLDGTNDYIDIGSSGTVGTLSAWFKPDTALSASGRTGYLVGFNSTSGPFGAAYAGIAFGNHTGTLTNEIISFHTNDWMYAYADASATVSADWHHVAVRWSGTEYEIYLDGTSVMNHSAQWGSASKAEIPYSSLNIGKRNLGTYFHEGLVDEVAVWHTALSASDITTLYNSGVPADISSLSPNGWWRMGDNDGGTGTTITDQGSGGNDGTLTNGPTFSTDTP
jgi:hypothetical protein